MTTQTQTLASFLLARIAEDEAVARAGISSQADPENGWGYGGYGSPTALTPHVGIIHERAQAEHIIRWHPARVLADCQAKRRIVEDADTYVSEFENEEYRTDDVDTAGRVAGRARSWRDDILRALALPYADHPDYRQEWRP